MLKYVIYHIVITICWMDLPILSSYHPFLISPTKTKNIGACAAAERFALAGGSPVEFQRLRTDLGGGLPRAGQARLRCGTEGPWRGTSYDIPIVRSLLNVDKMG